MPSGGEQTPVLTYGTSFFLSQYRRWRRGQNPWATSGHTVLGRSICGLFLTGTDVAAGQPSGHTFLWTPFLRGFLCAWSQHVLCGACCRDWPNIFQDFNPVGFRKSTTTPAAKNERIEVFVESEYHTHKSVQKGRGAIPVLYRVLVEGSTTVYASARILKVFFLE